jgi:hypothetical protein
MNRSSFFFSRKEKVAGSQKEKGRGRVNRCGAAPAGAAIPASEASGDVSDRARVSEF